MLLAAAAPALAHQGPITATGVLAGPADDSDLGPTPIHELTDETTGTNYRLMSGFVDLQDFFGRRVAIVGTRTPGPPDGPLVLDITRVAPAGGRTATATAPAGGDTLPATGIASATPIVARAALATGGLLARRIVR